MNEMGFKIKKIKWNDWKYSSTSPLPTKRKGSQLCFKHTYKNKKDNTQFVFDDCKKSGNIRKFSRGKFKSLGKLRLR